MTFKTPLEAYSPLARTNGDDNSWRKFFFMPELSRFYGIIIRMFSEPSEKHHVPHFHAYYGEPVAVFSIAPVALIIGFVLQQQQRLVEAWAELHADELLAD